MDICLTIEKEDMRDDDDEIASCSEQNKYFSIKFFFLYTNYQHVTSTMASGGFQSKQFDQH